MYKLGWFGPEHSTGKGEMVGRLIQMEHSRPPSGTNKLRDLFTGQAFKTLPQVINLSIKRSAVRETT